MKMWMTMLALALGGVSVSSHAEPYYELGKARSLQCWTDSHRTRVTVYREGNLHRVTAIQDGAFVLLDNVATHLRVAERFPAQYMYVGRTTGTVYLSLGQTTQDPEFQEFSPVGGTVRYIKGGLVYEPAITCRVQM